MASNTSNKSPVNLLSLDGGGIRGVSQLIILDEIMKRVQAKKQLTEVPKPCEYFHLIGGSGTGGLNAIMLGRLKMATEDALHNYKNLATAVFSPDNHKPFYKDSKFKTSILEAEIKKIVKCSCVGYTGDELLIDSSTGKDTTGNVFVCAKTSANLESPQRFRTYKGLPNQGPDCKIWEAGRATTATPMLFKPIMIVGLGGIRSSYIDAVGHNNPLKEVRDEAMQLFGYDCPIRVFLSIGTGHPGPNRFQQPRGMEKLLSQELMTTVTKIAADCESVSFDFARQYNSNPGIYFRFNVTHGTSILAADDWQRESDILAHTSAYLRDPNTSAMIEKIVESLCSSSRFIHNEDQQKVENIQENDPDTLNASNLASTDENQSKWKKDEELKLHKLALQKKLYGEEHPKTLLAMSNLAATYESQSRWKEAEELYLHVLPLRKRLLREEHPDTLITMSRLAFTYRSQSRWKETEELQLQVLTLRKKKIGEEYPKTLDAMSNLAATYESQSRWKEAEELRLHMLVLQKKIFGEKHPKTLLAISKLASIYQSQGRLNEAEELELQVLTL
ncbi:FabD/lysophospholipase-like protein [Armillaria solidipes]|uniref:FabD/lysophospholipase-like protein n=1 Tax=Armillaria solidipes TaxID=1076256 RepID=A0A2H3B8Z6_9AGAR|nr:FabD/lysophospholipase-like protein [Armillaria solidipes]